MEKNSRIVVVRDAVETMRENVVAAVVWLLLSERWDLLLLRLTVTNLRPWLRLVGAR